MRHHLSRHLKIPKTPSISIHEAQLYRTSHLNLMIKATLQQELLAPIILIDLMTHCLEFRLMSTQSSEASCHCTSHLMFATDETEDLVSQWRPTISATFHSRIYLYLKRLTRTSFRNF